AGLRVDLRAPDGRAVLVGTLVIVGAATVGKLAGAYGGGRVGGLPSRDAFVVAASLNARGALEVVVATVGLSVGVLNQASYAAIVVMALATTAIAAPLISLARRGDRTDGLG
ncbi:MAG: cation:proton antiporter, partial [Ilumatobacter sp.]|nr:cation:proton antiporter [Ilumatobacter sp.]